jgi:hypothetical protein
MENEFYEEDGISLGQIFKVMFLRWKLLLIIAASIFVVGILGTQLIYNKMKTKYSSTIEYVNVLGATDGTYINNSIFNYRDIIKLSNLNSIKNSNSDFASIDVEKIVNNEDITLTKKIDENLKTSFYTIQIKASYFKSSKQAKDFINAIFNIPVNELVSIYETSDNKSYLTAYNDCTDYESQIEALYNELNLLDNKYTELLKNYPESSVNGKNISAYQVLFQNKYGQVVEKIIDSNSNYTTTNNNNNSTTTETKTNVNNNVTIKYKVIEDLKNELSAKKYVKDFEANKASLLNRKASLEKQIEDNNIVIESLEDKIVLYNTGKNRNDSSYVEDPNDLKISNNNNDAFTPLTTEISKLQKENAEISSEIAIIDTQIANNGGSTDEIITYEAKLSNLYTSLVVSANEYTNVSTTVVKNYSNVEYESKAIEASGGLGLIVSALLSLVAGLVVACVVNLIIDREKLKPGYFDKENNSKKEEKVIENKEE